MKRILGAAVLYPLVLSLGCSNSGGGSAPDSNSGNGGGDNGGAGNSSSYAGSGNIFHVQGGSSSTGTGIPDLDSGCASQQTNAALTQVNIL